MFITTNLIGFGGSASTAPDLSFLQGSMNSSDLTTYTFSSQNVGAADPNRWIVLCVGGVTNAARSISSVTIGGVTATKIAESEGSTVYRHNSIWVAQLPTGTTADFVVTWSASLLRCGYQAYRLVTSVDPSTNYYDVQTDNTISGSSLSVSISSGPSGVVVASCTAVGSAAESITWTGATEDYDAQWGEATNQAMSSASVTPTSSPTTITATEASVTANSFVMCAASFV